MLEGAATDGGSVSDSSLISNHRRDREPSESSLSSRPESHADSQGSRASSLLTTSLRTAVLRGKARQRVTKPTGNEDRAPAGMVKKWQKHYSHGRWILLGRVFCQIACVLFLVACVLWSQLLYPWALDSKALFTFIVDAKDQAALDSTYLRWLRGLFADEEELTGGYALHSFYLWHITNAAEVVEQGLKPKLQEKGPFGYVKKSAKYDVHFSADDSAEVSYRSWAVYEPVKDAEDCKHMFFRMDKAKLRQGIPDCNGTTCNCADDEQEVTVVNAPFLRLMQEYGPKGLLSILSQEVFEKIKEAMTIGFVRAVKAYILPDVLDDVFHFRKAFLTLHVVLRSIFSSLVATNGSAVAVATLRANYGDSSIDCRGFRPSGFSNVCPWGLLSFVETKATSLGVNGTFSEAEAEFLLGVRKSANGSIFDAKNGTLSWLAAGRHAGHLPSPSVPHPADIDLTGNLAFNERVATVCTWNVVAGMSAPTLEECQAKVEGVLEWLFAVWYSEENELEGLVLDEWRGRHNDDSDVFCDVVGGVCPWRVISGDGIVGWNISASVASLVINPAEGDPRNDLSLYTVDGQTLWSRARTYCAADISTPVECDEGSHFKEAATDTLPALLRSADAGVWTWSDYLDQVCHIASNAFGTWVGESTWLNHVVVAHITESVKQLTGFELNGIKVEDIGYVQWTTGAVSYALFGVYSVSTISQDGIWEIMDESLHSLGPELWTQVSIAGYADMANLSVASGKELLDVLAEMSDRADSFRQFLLGQSTTYYGESDDWWEGPSSTTRTFDAGDVLFIEENPYGDFSSGTWEGSSTNNSLHDILSWMDTPVMSSPEQCYFLESIYEGCLDLVADGDEWPSDCAFFQTIMSNTVTGIECDASRIYGNAHPYPKKPGNVITKYVQTLVLEEVLKKEHLLCDDPDACDYSKGGHFTTQRARDIMFEGYTDALSIKLMNKNLSSRNLTIQCSSQNVVARDMYCRPLYDSDCTNTGFEVVHDVHGTILEVNRTGSNKGLWHSSEIVLPHGLGGIRNPIFAVHPGGSWENETFQKLTDCDQRTLQGEGGLWNGCDTTIQTGSEDPRTIGDTLSYRGNESLRAAPGAEAVLEVSGTDGAQYAPQKWEGFDNYKLTYRLRNSGLRYLGNDSLVIFKGEHLLQLLMARVESGATLQYPTRYLAEENHVLSIDVRLNRYVATAQSWLDGRERVGDSTLRDFNGMSYAVPVGMVSTQVLTGYATFVSDPHFLTNDRMNQQESDQVNYIAPDEALHQSLVDVEPVTGQALRRAIRLQFLFRIERNAFAPELLSSESSFTVCRPPTKDTMASGAGCFMYVPLWWFDDQRVMNPASATSLQEEFLSFVDLSLATAWKGLIGSSTLALFGSILWTFFGFLKFKHDRRVWVD